MSNSFAANAGVLAGLAARELGWRPATFWNATPSELALSLHMPNLPHTAPPSRAQIAAMIEREGQ
ncbi:phage tail assembly chaperone [Qipengyuania sp.]|uniref:phage tail assembly chaperone n=1 Tax=Qipengyuania sp. TaxID=2004515 RepID=UPI003734E099